MFAQVGDVFKSRYSSRKVEVLALKLDMPRKLKTHKDVKFAFLVVNPEIQDIRRYIPKWVAESTLRSGYKRV